MRIEFLTDDNPLYVLPFFEEFFQSYRKEFDTLQVSSCRPMGKRPRRRLLCELFHLYGGNGFVRLAARIVTARMLGLLPRSRSANKFYTIRQLCRARGIQFKRIDNPNAPDFVQGVRNRAPDLVISVACPYILKDELLGIPPLGCINIHHARLPNYKGMMPTFWQMFHGESEVGITIHYMARAVDQGPILLQESLKIEPEESLDHLIRRAKRFGASCMARTLRELASQTQEAVTVGDAPGSYFTFPTIEEIQEFRRRGLRAI